jgi:hypothetical protein
MSLEMKGQPAIHYTFTEDPPKELMDAYEQVAGNGLARVTVSTDMGIKDFGTGAGSMVTISLACNQDQQTMQSALNLPRRTGSSLRTSSTSSSSRRSWRLPTRGLAHATSHGKLSSW